MINPFITKKGLGRGLSSLIGDSEVKENRTTISISSIIRNKYQPRKKFEKESLEELTNSIKERGILQAIIVRKSEDIIDKYEIIAGERRWQAAQKAGLHKIPAVIIEADNLKSLEFAIVENVQRKDLNSIEEAEGYKRLIDEFNYDQEKVAKFIGKSRAHVSNCLRLLSLPKKIIEYIIDEKLSQGHAKILVGIENSELIAEKIISKKLSVRQSEAIVRITRGNKSNLKKNRDPNIMDVEKQIMDKIGLRVYLNNKKNNSGTLTIKYKDAVQMERLIKVIKDNY
tara:strand:+ start:183 stop:1034 length:852 start_codon:yes stop_codon:yes gene_type:complete